MTTVMKHSEPVTRAPSRPTPSRTTPKQTPIKEPTPVTKPDGDESLTRELHCGTPLRRGLGQRGGRAGHRLDRVVLLDFGRGMTAAQLRDALGLS